MSSEESWKLCTQVFDNLLFFDLWCHHDERFDISEASILFQIGMDAFNEGDFENAVQSYLDAARVIKLHNLDSDEKFKKLYADSIVHYGVAQGQRYVEQDNYLSAAEYFYAIYQAQIGPCPSQTDADCCQLFFESLIKDANPYFSTTEVDSLDALILSALEEEHSTVVGNLALGGVKFQYLNREFYQSRSNELKILLKRCLTDRYGERLQFSEKDQGYEIIVKVQEDYDKSVSQLKLMFERILRNPELTNYRRYDEDILRAVRSPRYNHLFTPHEAEFAQELHYIFGNNLDEYLKGSSKSLASSYEEFCSNCESLKRRLADAPSYMNSCLFLPAILNFHHLIQQDYKNRITSLSARLRIPPLRKHYPLLEHEREVEVALRISNEEGNCEARNCNLLIAVSDDSRTVEVINEEIDVEEILAGVSVEKICKLKVLNPSERISLDYILSWQNSAAQQEETSGTIQLTAQRRHVDWTSYKSNNPYSLDPISEMDKLKGRGEQVSRLQNFLVNMGSCRIEGQKRVGKSSIAKVFVQELLGNPEYGDYLPIYVEWGDVAVEDPAGYLGYRLCQLIDILYTEKKKKDCLVQIPNEADFKHRLAPIRAYLQDFHRYYPECKIVLFIDEFDEIPESLYKGEEGDAFFLTLRSLTATGYTSLVLIGGENLRFIDNYQGEKLNRVGLVPVDYFDLSHNIVEFSELITAPAQGILDFHDDAVQEIVQFSAGNPYFATWICTELYWRMVKREDSYVSVEDVRETIEEMVQLRGRQGYFRHFWDDGIQAEGRESEKIAFENAKILIALSQCSDNPFEYINLQKIMSHPDVKNIDPEIIEYRLSELVNRKVLERQDDLPRGYRTKVKLLHKWLRPKGADELRSIYSGGEKCYFRQQMGPKLRVTESEISEVAKKFPLYQGKQITAEDIHAWLEQFGDDVNQRLAFKLLNNIQFNDENFVREKMKVLYKSILRDSTNKGLARSIQGTTRNVFVSYIDDEGKSGQHFIYLFSQENNIYRYNSVNPTKIIEKLTAYLQENQVRGYQCAVVFIDDFIGTGESASKNFAGVLEQFDEKLPDWQDLCLIYYGAIVGFQGGADRIEQATEGRVRVFMMEEFTEEKKAFSPANNNIFDNHDEIQRAKGLCEYIGRSLRKSHPLGWQNSQALIVFEHNAPNNTLPVFYASGTHEGKEWRPLFPRK